MPIGLKSNCCQHVRGVGLCQEMAVSLHPHARSCRGSRVFFTTQLGDRTMMTCGLKRSVLFLPFVASVLFSGCVSQGKYDELQGQYNTLQGQYNTLQNQNKQLQQTAANQAAQNAAMSTELAATKNELAAKGAHTGRLQEA